MDMQNVIYAVAVLFIMGIVFAILLGVAAKVFAVEVDERVPLVRECLPGSNCGGCGFPRCDGLAAAVFPFNDVQFGFSRSRIRSNL